MMSFKDAVIVCVKDKYSDFSGRASRSEFWWFFLFQTLVSFALMMVAEKLTIIATLALLVPYLASAVRRLHDTGRSGWWLLLSFVPLINLVFFYFLVSSGDEGQNEYGADPLEVSPLIIKPLDKGSNE